MKRNLVLLCACLIALLSACSSDEADEPASLARSADPAAAEGDHSFSNSAGAGAGTGLPTGGSTATSAAGMGGAAGAGGAAGTSSSPDFGSSAAGTGGEFDSSSEPPLEPSEGSADAGAVVPDDQLSSGTLTAGAWDDNRNFDRFSEYRSDLLQSGDLPGAITTSDGDHASAHELFGQLGAAHVQLDIALVIDTTGSMGDEIDYLQTELSAISQSIEDTYPNADQRWALVLYRDQGDAYVAQSYEFTGTLEDFRMNLATAVADGGGDLPEAPEEALAETNGLAWRAGDDIARLAFWVADAPHHDDKADAMAEAILGAQDLGIHIYPVASSGVDELTELTMRSAAQLTGGRYLFLTNDSGVGGDHKEPTIPCYFVTKLDDAIVRMVDIEMSGEYREPIEAEIIRNGGDPEDGACTLEGGDEVEIF